jgi:hypothetical protein
METPALMCEVLRRTSSLVLRAELAQGARKGDHLEMLSPPSALRLGFAFVMCSCHRMFCVGGSCVVPLA